MSAGRTAAVFSAALVVVAAAGGVLLDRHLSAQANEVGVPAPVSTTASTQPSNASVTVPALSSTSVPSSSSAVTSASSSSGSAPSVSVLPTSSSKAPATSSSSATSSSAATSSSKSVSAPTTTADTEPAAAAPPAVMVPTSKQTAAQAQAAVDAAVATAAAQGVQEDVAVMDRATGKLLATGGDPDEAVPSMSIVKLMIAADVLNQAGGPSGLDDDTLDKLQYMITHSDDGDAQDFYDEGGGVELVERVVKEYDLEGSAPTPEEEYWGDTQITATDIASLLQQMLASKTTGPWLAQAMESAADEGSDGFDQNFGMNALTGTGSKQGWGCCLGDVLAIHSAGFTENRIVVVLSTSEPDASPSELGTAEQMMEDPGTQLSMREVTATAAAAAA